VGVRKLRHALGGKGRRIYDSPNTKSLENLRQRGEEGGVEKVIFV